MPLNPNATVRRLRETVSSKPLSPWLSQLLDQEVLFCQQVAPKLNLEARINPKREHNKLEPGLKVNNFLADLHIQRAPFYPSQVYGFVPSQTVTLSKPAMVRYVTFHPDIVVVFHVDYYDLKGVWLADVSHLNQLIQSRRAVEHVHRSKLPDWEARKSVLFQLKDLHRVGYL